MQAGARLTQAARINEGEDKKHFVLTGVPQDKTQFEIFKIADIGEMSAALPSGVTARFDIAEQVDTPRLFEGRPVRRHVAIELYRQKADTALQLALIVEDLLLPRLPLDTTESKMGDDKSESKPSNRKATTMAATQPMPSPQPVRELLLIDRPAFTDTDRFSITLPYHFGGSDTQAIALFVQVLPGSDDPSHKQVFDRCLVDMTRSLDRTRAATQPYRELADNPEWPAFQSALDALSRPGTPRAAMLFLASQTNVVIFEDIALSADDNLRGELSRKVFAKLGIPAKTHVKEALAWILESASYELLSEQSANGKLPPELAAILSIHAGEAGRHAGSLDEGLKTSVNRGDFAVRLIAENYIYLEDSSPASRVRAFDWLHSRDRAPSGYDPLGTAKDRRSALERAMNPDSAKPQTAGGVK